MRSSAVSVVMPAWNAERFIEEAIRSALDQTSPPTAIIVVDDGSIDATAAIAAGVDARVTVLRREHAGVGPTRTAGVAATTTEFIAFLDADDVWLPRKLERQMEVIDSDATLDAVFCLMDEFHDLAYPPPAGVRAPKRGVAAPLSGALLMRRHLVEQLGPFNANPAGDWLEWWSRARSHELREEFVPEVLWRRRLHAENNSFPSADSKAILDVARAHRRALRAKTASQ
jgi:glycosyltransferase involved in cell wall biosynthesis